MQLPHCVSECYSLQDGKVVWDKGRLRKIVGAICAEHWTVIGPAVEASPRHKKNGGAIDWRGKPSDFAYRLCLGDLIEIAFCLMGPKTIAIQLAMPGEKLTNVGEQKYIEELILAGRKMFGPSTRAASLIRSIMTASEYSTDTSINVYDFSGLVSKADINSAVALDSVTIRDMAINAPPNTRYLARYVANELGLELPTQTTTQPESKTVTTVPTIDISSIQPMVLNLLNQQLTSLGLPSLPDMAAAANQGAEASAALGEARQQLEAARTQLTKAQAMPVQAIAAPASGEWPAYKVVTKPAVDVFLPYIPTPNQAAAKRMLAFDVPVIEWEGGVAPSQVPTIDPDHAIDAHMLLRTLYSFITNTPGWAHGHTGTGKTSGLEQIAARLGWPVEVINLDSEITRLDIMGRDVLSVENGQTVTRFEEGIIPRAMQRPGLLILDECDFGRPDVMYAIQRLLTGTGITLTEDAGRYIKPHPLFRIWATANTRGQGDETGLYQGARIQSGAFLNRFGVWLEVKYLDRDELGSVLEKRVPQLDKREREKVIGYTLEHQRAFTEATVSTPFSMRDAVNLARAIALYRGLFPQHGAKHALDQTVLDKCSPTDAQTLRGIIDRLFA